MKLIKAFVHHVRVPPLIQALADAGYRNITLQDVKGMLKPLGEHELDFSQGMVPVISEVRVSLVCEDQAVKAVTTLIREVAAIGPHVSGWVYVSPIDQALPIGGDPPA